jgi:hypothetical protein
MPLNIYIPDDIVAVLDRPELARECGRSSTQQGVKQ